jgi:2-polyprenyl-3-methyl-5-hydroxy-6-metoxy-1,4-benzoquinol methylase
MFRRASLALRALLSPTTLRLASSDPAAFDSPSIASRQAEMDALRDQLDLVLYRQIEFHKEIRTLIGQATLPPAARFQNKPDNPPALPEGVVFDKSVVCRQEDMDTSYFTYWANKVGHPSRYHRKVWEFVFICQALYERGLLKEGMRGLGFGVGEEPLTAYFASQGCKILGTDMATDAAVQAGWTLTDQHAAGKEALRKPWLFDDKLFDANVEFRTCDMNAIPSDLTGYDFCWSACALEHLGSIEKGLAFIERSVDCLRPGGFAIHTTEYNLSSYDDTLSEGVTVLFRLQDMEALYHRLAAKGHTMAPLDVDPGHGEMDRYLDVPPYLYAPHLKLMLSGYATTSFGIIVQKAW